MEQIDQAHCPICGTEFDIVDIACFFGARGPSFCYCACSTCKKAWDIEEFKFGSTAIGRREVEYVEGPEW
jgi:hypothetical protein